MNRQKIVIIAVFLLLTGVASGLILHESANQKLGRAGVLTRPLPGTHNLQVVLPQNVPGYTAEVKTQAQIVVVSLPDDTSFGRCIYTAKDGFQTIANVVLMGTDRSSIHKPQVCLTAQGWKLDDAASKVEKIRLQKPIPYDLPVMRLTGTLQANADGQTKTYSCVYAYWYVDGSRLTAKNWQLMWWMARDLMLTGVLDRFSYVSYFSYCVPGQEDATFKRMKQVIIDTVPEFQLVPRAVKGRMNGGH